MTTDDALRYCVEKNLTVKFCSLMNGTRYVNIERGSILCATGANLIDAVSNMEKANERLREKAHG